jgi:hypothetical protein
MKITNLCIILLFFSAKLHAQTLDQVGYYPCVGCNQHYFDNDATNTNFTYNAYVACGASNVSSDYDMRIAGGASRWHRGIDYSADGGNNLHKKLQETKQKSGITNT